MKQYFEILKKVPLFAGILDEDIFDLLTCLNARVRAYSKGEAVFLTGEPAGAVGIVCAGGVQVIKEDFMGNRTILSKLESGDLFGEAFACGQIERLPVSVLSVAGSEILFIDYSRIVTTCSSACVFHSRLIENMLGVLASKNVMLNQKIEVLSKRSTREKLIAYLSAQAQKAGSNSFIIPFNRQELADYLCVDRSAMSNELGKLRDEGVLSFEKSRFALL